MRQVSVIICSLNPRPDYFGRVLESLRAQTLATDQWELLLVDNASDRPLADSWDLSWHPHHRKVREEEQGLTPARLRGIKESEGQLIVFVDDDNLPASDYLERALEVERAYPYLSVFGAGALKPEFEVEPRPHVRHLCPLLGLRTVSRPLWTNNPKDSPCIPWGAGLCAKRAAAIVYVQLVERMGIGHLLDRRGSHLFSGGDDLFSWVSAQAGWGFGLFPTLRITHLVRAERVSEPYLLRLINDHAYSHAILRYVLSGELPPHLQPPDKIRILLHGVRRGRFSMKCHLASASGVERAVRDIASEDVHPLESGEFAS
jgi:glycosyltransferase involved in cell wall biosynthesis